MNYKDVQLTYNCL